MARPPPGAARWRPAQRSVSDWDSNTITSVVYALGIRWDMSDTSVLKLFYGERDNDLDRAEHLKQSVYGVEFAWKF